MRCRPLRQALDLVPPGASVVAGPGCGTPLTLLGGIAELAGSRPLGHVRTGLQLGGLPLLPAAAEGALRWSTWHVTAELRAAVAAGTVGYLPLRASEVPSLLERWQVDVALVRVSPPDAHGYVSLGPSVSYPRPAVEKARIVLGEVDPDLPRTHGESRLHTSRFAALVEATQPTPVYPAATPTELSDRIAAHVLPLLPPAPSIQLGIGAVPESLTRSLGSADLGPIRFVGMGTDGMVPLLAQGIVPVTATVPDPGILAGELMGSATLLRAADDHPAIGVYASTSSHTAMVLGRRERFVSINSAIEVDLTGQINAEVVRGAQVGAVGGSVDFVESAFASPGGLRITALPATTADGRISRIVPRLSATGTVTIGRHSADIIVTEYGTAELRGRSLAERREALIAIAHPAHRDRLADQDEDHNPTR